jgi:hypothetical protein
MPRNNTTKSKRSAKAKAIANNTQEAGELIHNTVIPGLATSPSGLGKEIPTEAAVAEIVPIVELGETTVKEERLSTCKLLLL